MEVCAALGLLELIGEVLANYIKTQEEDKQLTVAITLIIWVSAITSAFLDNIPVRPPPGLRLFLHPRILCLLTWSCLSTPPTVHCYYDPSRENSSG